MRIRVAAFASILLVFFALAVPGAGARGVVDSYCSPTGDYCTGVFREAGRLKLRIDTFSFRGRYELCVRPPGGSQECKWFHLRSKGSGIYGSRIDFARQFFHGSSGRYAVAWYLNGYQLGRKLHFGKR